MLSNLLRKKKDSLGFKKNWIFGVLLRVLGVSQGYRRVLGEFGFFIAMCDFYGVFESCFFIRLFLQFKVELWQLNWLEEIRIWGFWVNVREVKSIFGLKLFLLVQLFPAH